MLAPGCVAVWSVKPGFGLTEQDGMNQFDAIAIEAEAWLPEQVFWPAYMWICVSVYVVRSSSCFVSVS